MTHAYTLAFVVIAGLSLSACDKSSDAKPASTSPKGGDSPAPVTATPPPQIAVETGSPDQAVKSWWKVLDLKEKISAEECNKNKQKDKPVYVAYFPKVAQEDVLRTLTPKEAGCMEDVYERDIQEVKAESETRAIVFVKVKNVTPVPAGAEPDEYDKKHRKDGFRFKYLVEKTSEGWKVSQVYRFDEINQKYLNKDPWEKLYKADDKPRYPAYVFTQ